MTPLQAPLGATLQERLRALTPEQLLGMRRGLEKESLRAQPSGALALTPHPAALGSPLTHPGITTDFSESQIELVTGVHASPDDVLQELTGLHQFTYQTLREAGDEMLWVSSMPCGLPTDETIPIARFGDFGHSLQLVAARRDQRAVLCGDSQLSPPGVFAALSVWRLACGVFQLCGRPPARAAVAQ